jgi:hypothetical protein
MCVGAAIAVMTLMPLNAAFAQEQTQQPPPGTIPEPGEPRAQEQLPKAPPEEVLEAPPPIEKKAAEPPADVKPDPLPNTLPPAKKIEPKVPNT